MATNDDKTTSDPAETSPIIKAAVSAFKRGHQPVPIHDHSKRPFGAAWVQLRWNSPEQVQTSFEKWADMGAGNLGVLLGEPSGGLVDVDLDHPKALRLRDFFLPPSAAESGRPGRPRSHRWYIIADDEIPPTRQYKMPDGSMIIELRSTGTQTVIPPSIWTSSTDKEHTERTRWENRRIWGGKEGPARVDGRKLSIQVALTGLGAVLLDAWPKAGSRHDAYLALAGGLLRLGDGVHPYWERNLPVLIRALAVVTADDDGPDARVQEVMGTTLRKLAAGDPAIGFTRLAEIIGSDHAEQARRIAREVEALAGFVGHEIRRDGERVRQTVDALESGSVAPTVAPSATPGDDAGEEIPSTLDPVDRNPMEERVNTWAAVDMEPYLSGEVVIPPPSLLTRTDGVSLFYPGKVNTLFGPSESGKTWVALWAGVQEMARGERFLYIDFEDEPVTALTRLKAMGSGDDDLRTQFRYIHPEEPISDLQRYANGEKITAKGLASHTMLKETLQSYDPTLIIVDGMTMLYGLHGHSTNDATGTDVVTSWLKKLTRGGRSCVIVIDHTGKGAGAGASPIGAHHKVAMVQGSALRADPISRPIPGHVGEIRLWVHKDRPGRVRAAGGPLNSDREQHAATFYLDSREPGYSVVTLDPPDPEQVVLGDSEEASKELQIIAEAQEASMQILGLFNGDEHQRVNTSIVEAAMPDLSREVINAAWRWLVQDGIVIREGKTRWTCYRLAKPRPVEDPEDERDHDTPEVVFEGSTAD